MENQVGPPPEGDKNTGPQREVVYGLFLSIAIILVTLRFYVRARMVKKLWWDDIFLLLGILTSVAAFCLAVARVRSGSGRHAYYLLPKQILFIVKLEYIELPVFILSGMFTRISICLFLLRIFTTNKAWKIAIYVIMTMVMATNVSAAIVIVPQCKPIAKLWNPTIKGTCWSQEVQWAIYYYHGGFSIFSDLLLAFLPIYFLKDIQISIRTKLSICALMSLGLFTGICAINRTAVISQINAGDITYSTKNLYIWGGLEINIASIAATIPGLRPLWAKSTNRNQKNRRQARPPNDKQHLKSFYVMMDPQTQADSPPSCLKTSITAQGQKVGSEARSLHDSTGIMKTSEFNTQNFRKFEGKWIPEHSSLSDREREGDEIA